MFGSRVSVRPVSVPTAESLVGAVAVSAAMELAAHQLGGGKVADDVAGRIKHGKIVQAAIVVHQ